MIVPPRRCTSLHAATACAMLLACRSKSEAPPPPPVAAVADARSAAPEVPKTMEPPRVEGHGYGPFDEATLLLVATKRGIVVDGKAIVQIDGGRVDPEDVEGGVRGIAIPRLATFVQTAMAERARRPGHEPRLGLLLDRTLPYRILVMAMYSLREHVTRFELVAQSGPEHVAAPLALPAKAPVTVAVAGKVRGADAGAVRGTDRGRAIGAREPERAGWTIGAREPERAGWMIDGVAGPQRGVAIDGGAARGAPIDMPLQIAVAIAKDRILLWSISGLEGTLAKPALTLDPASPTAVADLGAALARLVGRRWPDGQRAAADRRILMLADDAIPIQRIAEVVGAVRATPEGKELFDEILLSAGFE